jgi:hypothetical protein
LIRRFEVVGELAGPREEAAILDAWQRLSD